MKRVLVKRSIVVGLFMVCVLPVFSGCGTASKVQTSEDNPDVVLDRIDRMSRRPDWIKESEPFRIESGNVFSLGQTQIPADHRVEAAYRIAENNAKAAIASAIEQKLEFIFQGAEEGTSIDATQARYIGSEASKITTQSLRLQSRYWEKVASTLDNGQRVTRYVVFALVSMPEKDFKKAMLDAAARAQGKEGISSDFREKIDKHWDQFVGAQTGNAGAR